MAHIFQSLGDLGDHLDRRAGSLPPAYVADPPMTLTEAADSHSVWASQPSVRKVIDFIARNVASVNLHQYARVSDNERRRISEGPVADLLRRPSQEYLRTPYRFWRDVLTDGLLHDRWCVIRSSEGGREWLTRIPARRFYFKTDALDRVAKVVVYTKDGETYELDPEQCLYGAGYSTRGANGTSAMTTLKNVLRESDEAVRFRADLLSNGARIPGYVSRKTPWPSKEARDRFAAGWREFRGGGARAGGEPLLDDGMTYETTDAFKPVDLELMAGRTLTDVEVSSAFHIAPELVGARQGTYSSVDAFRQMLWGPSLGPYIIDWEQIVNAAFGDGDGTTYIEANLEAKLRGSFIEQATVTSAAVGAPWMLRDEARARMNLPPVDGGDQLVTPLNVLIGGQASPRDADATSGRLSGAAGQKAAHRGATPRRKERAPETHDAKFLEVLMAFFERQRRSVASAFGADPTDWWDGERWDRELSEDLWRLAIQTSETVAADVADGLGEDPDDYDVDRTLAFLAAVAQRQAAAINVVTVEQITAALADIGDGVEPLSVIDHVFDVARDARAEQIATATVTEVSAFAAEEVGRQLLDEEGTKTWVTGSNPRPSHAAMDGETVPLGSKFSNGMDHPGDSRNIHETAGCNCSIRINREED